MNTLLSKIKETVKSPEFQRNAIRATGGAVAFVGGIAASRLVHKVVDMGVKSLIDKYLPEIVEVVTEATAAE